MTGTPDVDPQEGSMTLDSADQDELAPDELRRALSVAFLDYSPYQFMSRRNIWPGTSRRLRRATLQWRQRHRGTEAARDVPEKIGQRTFRHETRY